MTTPNLLRLLVLTVRNAAALLLMFIALVMIVAPSDLVEYFVGWGLMGGSVALFHFRPERRRRWITNLGIAMSLFALLGESTEVNSSEYRTLGLISSGVLFAMFLFAKTIYFDRIIAPLRRAFDVPNEAPASIPSSKEVKLPSAVRAPQDKPLAKRTTTQKVNLNQATEEELASLPGFNWIVAQNIIAEREARGGFSRVEDLLVVRGVSQRMLEAVRELIDVDEPNRLQGAANPFEAGSPEEKTVEKSAAFDRRLEL